MVTCVTACDGQHRMASSSWAGASREAPSACSETTCNPSNSTSCEHKSIHTPGTCSPPCSSSISSSTEPTPAESPSPCDEAPLSLCRVCWETSDDRDGGLLLSPCSCKGSVQHIHLRCLQRWQSACKARGQPSRGRRCDLCSARFVITIPGAPARPSLKDLCTTATSALTRTHVPILLFRAYLSATALRVLSSGASASLSGASHGMLLGARLIDRQLSMVLHNTMLRTFIQPGLFLVPTFCCFPFYVQIASVQLLTTTTAGFLLGGCSGALTSVRALMLWHADLGTLVRRRLGSVLLQGASSVARGVLRLFCGGK